LIDRQLIDRRLIDRQLIDRQLIDRQLIDRQLIDLVRSPKIVGRSIAVVPSKMDFLLGIESNNRISTKLLLFM
jgi:hypothetical protein